MIIINTRIYNDLRSVLVRMHDEFRLFILIYSSRIDDVEIFRHSWKMTFSFLDLPDADIRNCQFGLRILGVLMVEMPWKI